MKKKNNAQNVSLVDLFRSYKDPLFKKLELVDPQLTVYTERALAEIEGKNICSKRHPDSKIFAVFYIATIITGNYRTQKEIYQISGVAPQTIIATYKEIAEALDIEVIIPYYKRNIQKKPVKTLQKIIEPSWQELGIDESELKKDFSLARAEQEISEAKLSAVYAFVRSARKAIEESALSWKNFKYTDSDLEKLILEARAELAVKDLAMLKTMVIEEPRGIMSIVGRIKRTMKDGAISEEELKIKNIDTLDKFIREAQRMKIKESLSNFIKLDNGTPTEISLQQVYFYKKDVDYIEKMAKKGIVSWKDLSQIFGEEINREKLFGIIKNARIRYLKEIIKMLIEGKEKDYWKQKDWIREICAAVTRSWVDSREIKNPEIRRAMLITWEDLGIEYEKINELEKTLEESKNSK